jgi:solute:Na+ symporter, SSS family
VAITDFVQTIAIVVGLSFLAVDLVISVGGFGKIWEAAPVGTFQFFPDAKPVSMIHWVAAWMTLGLGSIPQQDIFQRVMAAKSERSSVNACYTSAFMYLTVAFIPILIAFCGRILYPDMAKEDPQMMLPHMVLAHSGLGLQVLFFGALVSAILSTCSGAMLAPATVIGENLVRPLFKDIEDKQLLRIMRISLVAVALVTGLMALSRDNIYELVSESSALSLVSLFVPLIGGLYWKKASNTGAILSMVLGMAVWLLCRWTLPDIPDEELKQISGFWPTLKAVPSMLWGFAASILGMLLGTWFWPQREPS